MFISKKRFVVIITIVFVFSLFTAVIAESSVKEIVATLDSTLKIKLNGESFVPKNSDGSVLSPIIYNGRTYLPVRAVGEALNIPVDFDEKTRTVLLGKKESNKERLIDFVDKYSAMFMTTDSEILTAGANKHTFGMYANDRVPDGDSGTADFKLDKKYTKLHFKIWALGNDTAKFGVDDNDKKIVLKVSQIKESDGVKEITVDVSDVETLRIWTYAIGSNKAGKVSVRIADAYLE